MKKMSLSLVLVLMFATLTQAQESTVEFGLKGGLNFANLNYESNSESKTRTSVHAGLLAHFHLNKNWAIQPELMFSGQGAKYDGGRTDKLGYLNIPVLVMYMFDNGFRLHTGPQLGFLLNAKSEIGDLEVDIKEELNTTDVSWAFGIGYIAPSGFGVDARYNLGLTSISDGDNSVKNSVFQLGILYQFRKVSTKNL
jgi:Outer membrane protein beta-barrel domain